MYGSFNSLRDRGMCLASLSQSLNLKAMKRFFIKMLCVFLSSALFSQVNNKPVEAPSIDPKQVPAVVIQNFTTRYPNVSAAWHLDGKNYRANYIDPESKLGCVVVYDKAGNVVRTESEVDSTGYPSAIGDYYSDNYPGETYQVWYTDDKTGSRTLYYVNRNDETIWFDSQGKALPAKKTSTTLKKDDNKK